MPNPNLKLISVNVPIADLARWKTRAIQERRSLTSLIAVAMDCYLHRAQDKFLRLLQEKGE
jgi:hypothetical protein